MKTNRTQNASFEQLTENILSANNTLQGFATKTINQTITLRNWLIGYYIVEYEQNGSDRAQYGNKLVEKLAERLNKTGLGISLLRKTRAFYLSYPYLIQLFQNQQTVSVELKNAMNTIHLPTKTLQIHHVPSAINPKFHTSADALVAKLSFSHIVELLTVEDPLVRFFYETECIKGTWSVRELRRQISSNLHIRIGLSEDKMKAMLSVNNAAEQPSPLLSIRDPYTFEFLGLNAQDVVTETDLENALIRHLQDFLLELGKGFCFEARQKRIIIDGEYYFADLVFYNRVLHCNVIVEIKNDEFRHEHIGQLNAYVSYYAEHEMQPGDNPPVGILLCTCKGKKMVEYALGNMDNQLFVSTYQLQLPCRQQLEQFILNECQEHA